MQNSENDENSDENYLSIHLEYDESITNAEIEWIIRIADFSLQYALWDSIDKYPAGVDKDLLIKIIQHKDKHRQIASRYFSPLSPFSFSVKQISTEKSIIFIYNPDEILKILNQIWIQGGPTIQILAPFFLERLWEYLTNKRYKVGPRPPVVSTKKSAKEQKKFRVKIEFVTKFFKAKAEIEISKNKSIQKNNKENC